MEKNHYSQTIKMGNKQKSKKKIKYGNKHKESLRARG